MHAWLAYLNNQFMCERTFTSQATILLLVPIKNEALTPPALNCQI